MRVNRDHVLPLAVSYAEPFMGIQRRRNYQPSKSFTVILSLKL